MSKQSIDKEKYISANLEILYFDSADIVTSSNIDPGGWITEDSW